MALTGRYQAETLPTKGSAPAWDYRPLSHPDLVKHTHAQHQGTQHVPRSERTRT